MYLVGIRSGVGEVNAEALEPRSLTEAKSGADWSLWKSIIEEEMATLKVARTWELVVQPEGVNIVGSQWISRGKKEASGTVIQYKTSLVPQGFPKYRDSIISIFFGPVAKLASIRTVLAIAAERIWNHIE